MAGASIIGMLVIDSVTDYSHVQGQLQREADDEQLQTELTITACR